jgi:uncharacterized protein YndB with AHSA1/START domain
MAARGNDGTVPPASELVITRVFDAPRDLVFKAWTEAERLERWWGPKGVTLHVCAFDLRPGGVFHYRLRLPQGQDWWGKFAYRDIVVPERLVFVVSFTDEAGNPTRHPLSPNWPLEVLTTVTFAEHEGGTALSMRSVPINATESERKTFEDGHESVRRGTAGTFDQLAEYLANA